MDRVAGVVTLVLCVACLAYTCTYKDGAQTEQLEDCIIECGAPLHTRCAAPT